MAGCGILPEDEAVAPGTFSDDVEVDEHSDFDGEPALSLELVLGDCWAKDLSEAETDSLLAPVVDRPVLVSAETPASKSSSLPRGSIMD